MQAKLELQFVSNLTLEIDVPSPPRVLREASGLDGALDLTREPQTERPAVVSDVITFKANIARLEGDLPRRTLVVASLQTAFLKLTPPRDILGTDLLNRIHTQAQHFGSPRRLSEN